MSEKYELIDEEKDTTTPSGQKKYTTAAMCGWLEVSTAGYYEWRDRPASAAVLERKGVRNASRVAAIVLSGGFASGPLIGHGRRPPDLPGVRLGVPRTAPDG